MLSRHLEEAVLVVINKQQYSDLLYQVHSINIKVYLGGEQRLEVHPEVFNVRRHSYVVHRLPITIITIIATATAAIVVIIADVVIVVMVVSVVVVGESVVYIHHHLLFFVIVVIIIIINLISAASCHDHRGAVGGSTTIAVPAVVKIALIQSSRFLSRHLQYGAIQLRQVAAATTRAAIATNCIMQKALCLRGRRSCSGGDGKLTGELL